MSAPKIRRFRKIGGFPSVEDYLEHDGSMTTIIFKDAMRPRQNVSLSYPIEKLEDVVARGVWEEIPVEPAAPGESPTPRTMACLKSVEHGTTAEQLAAVGVLAIGLETELSAANRELAELREDKADLDWLMLNGRVSKMCDGWNAWKLGDVGKSSINADVRLAIRAARNGDTK